MDNYLDLMRARREQILERFYAALDRAGRPHDAASLIAVSKTRTARRSWFASSRVWRSIRSCPRCASI